MPRPPRSPISYSIVTLAIALLQCAPLPRARAGMDPADRVSAEHRLTSGSWKITFQKGWSIVRVFDKDGTFWTPGRPDESGHWAISTTDTVVQTYSNKDGREDTLELPLNGQETITGTARDRETISAVHDKAVPATAPVPALTAQQKAATADLLTSGRWQVTDLDWDQPHFYHFDKEGTWHAEKRPSQHGQWTIDGNIITLAFPDGHKNYLLFPLDPKGTLFSDENGAPGTAVFLTPNPPPASPAPAKITTKTPVTPREWLLSGQWKLTTKTRNDIRVFMEDGTFKTLNDPDAKGQWMITNDFVIMLLPGDHRDVIYMPLNPKGGPGLAYNGDALTAALDTPAMGNSAPATVNNNPAAGNGPSSSGTAPAPTAPPQDQATAADLLASGPWTISGEGDAASSRTRTFARDGTFTTTGHEDEYGWWKIVNNIIILTFADAHKESLKLPLDPKGTSGLDRNGAPISAVLQPPGKY